jgi:hypothetical protein
VPNVSDMTIHLYAQCWNDSWMLPFFFRHYDSWVDRYFLYDDNSTDATLAILEAHDRVQVSRFTRTSPDSFVLSEQRLSNHCWKQSRGVADWVIVTDIDEHLYHPQGMEYLTHCAAEGVTLIPALGYQMISADCPVAGQNLCEEYTIGAPSSRMMKPSIFNPNAIKEINFSKGRHKAKPKGRVKTPDTDEMLLFHYKYMELLHTYARHQMLHGGLRSRDLRHGWGKQYTWSLEELKSDWQTWEGSTVDTTAIRANPASNYPFEPWWTSYRARQPNLWSRLSGLIHGLPSPGIRARAAGYV